MTAEPTADPDPAAPEAARPRRQRRAAASTGGAHASVAATGVAYVSSAHAGSSHSGSAHAGSSHAGRAHVPGAHAVDDRVVAAGATDEHRVDGYVDEHGDDHRLVQHFSVEEGVVDEGFPDQEWSHADGRFDGPDGRFDGPDGRFDGPDGRFDGFDDGRFADEGHGAPPGPDGRPGAGDPVAAAAVPIDEAAWALLSEAVHLYQSSRRATVWLRHHLNRLTEPLRLAVTGCAGAGKSTLVNALVGEDVAPVEVDGAPTLFAWYQDGPALKATLCPTQGPAYEVPVTRGGSGLRVMAAGWAGGGDAGEIDEVVVEWPTRALRRTHLIDTPAVVPADGGRTTRAADRVLREADAVLYLTCQLDDEDLAFLRPPPDSVVAAATAGTHVLTVLSRADETTGGRIDALVVAKQLARRRRRTPGVGALCQDVLAVAPRLAVAGRTLTHADFATITALAGAGRTELEPYLLSTDRFTAETFPVAVPVEARRQALLRFGLFGVRLATTLVRTGSRTREALAEQLVRHSGLADLQEAVAELIVDRRPVFKARSALLALEWVLRAEPLPAAAHLAGEVERLLATAHDFREVRLLAALRTRQVGFTAELSEQARRLVGAYGTAAHDRLGLSAGAPADQVAEAAVAAALRWRRMTAGHDLTSAQRRAAEVVVRSCEAMVIGRR